MQGLVSGMAADIDVYLRGGTYRLAQAFTLGPSDSGTNGRKVVYAAYPGEKPVLNGAQKITGFSVFDSAKNIYRAAVPAGTQSRQLFVDGVRAQRARGPLNPGGFTLSGSSFTTSDTSYASFTNASSVEVAYDKDWKHMRCPLAGITVPSGGGSSLNVDPDCFVDNNTAVVNRGFPFNGAGLPKLDGLTWVENAYFTYTGPSDNQPWGEIDVEILGKNTYQMQTNYFTNGAGGHESIINLGFDASTGYHSYAFEWWNGGTINWFVDGVLVHQENGSRGALPTHPQRIMMNLWPGIGVDGWLQPFTYPGTKLTANYDWAKYTKY